MTEDFLDRFDDYDCGETCPTCGKPMQMDSDGDGVMTMSYYYCEECEYKTYGDAVEVTEKLLKFGRENGLLPE